MCATIVICLRTRRRVVRMICHLLLERKIGRPLEWRLRLVRYQLAGPGLLTSIKGVQRCFLVLVYAPVSVDLELGWRSRQ